MARQNDLFDLIKSLTKGEKAFFRKNLPVTSAADTTYIKIFDALDGMQEYDEDLLLKKLKVKKVGTSFSVAKNYLQKALLKSLQQFHAEKSASSTLYSYLEQVEILTQKGLYQMAQKTLERAKELAKDSERLTHWLESLQQLRKVVSNLPIDKHTLEYLDALQNEVSEVLDKMRNENIIYTISKKQYVLLKLLSFEGVRSPEHQAALDALINHPDFKEENCNTYTAHCTYYTVLGHHYYANGNMEKSFEWRKRTVDYMNANPRLAKYNQWGIYISINTFLNICIRLFKHEDYKKYIHLLRNYHNLDAGYAPRVFLMYANLEMNYAFSCTDFEHGRAIMPQIVKDLELYGPQVSLNLQIPINFNLGALCYFLKQYGDAVPYFSFCAEQKTDENISAVARVALLMMHYELNNYDLIDYMIRNTERHFKNQQRLFAFEKTFLDAMKKIIRTPDKKELAAEFAALKNKLVELSADPKERNAIGVFDFMGWLKKHSGTVG